MSSVLQRTTPIRQEKSCDPGTLGPFVYPALLVAQEEQHLEWLAVGAGLEIELEKHLMS